MKKYSRAFAWSFCCLSLATFAGCFGKGFNLNVGDAAPGVKPGDSGIKTSSPDATSDSKTSSDGSRDQASSPDVPSSTGGSGGGIATGGAEASGAGGSAGGDAVGGMTGSGGLGGGAQSGGTSALGSGGNVGSNGGTAAVSGSDAAPDAPASNPDGSAPLAQGKPCAADGDCGSGNCVDGVCCNKNKATCSGCNACATSLTGAEDGTCSPVSTGLDPHSACADESATNACGNDGTCDGKGGCRKVSAGQTCGKGSCASTGSTFTPAPTCDGAGTCQAAKAQDCGAFQCAATGCLKNCTLQTDCDSASYCDTTASPAICKAKNANGTKASNTYECTSGIVADGVCCDTNCTGCSACTTALNGQTSSKDGTCLAVAANTTAPHGYCTASPPCGQDGTCDGNKGCKYPAPGTSCDTASCLVSTLTTKTCDSTHACASASNPCQNSLVCASSSACKTGSCSADTDCIAGDYCASGTCTPKRDNGGTCSGASQCKNGNCVSGICCNTACGLCNSCTTGTCTPVSSGATCGTGKVCSGGNCQTGCWIGGAGGNFVADGTTNAGNACQICNSSSSSSGWSNNSGAAVPCGSCGGVAACTNQAAGPCSKDLVTYYQDHDGDGYGNPLAATASSCNQIPGYVANHGDCDDADVSWYAGKTRCTTYTDPNGLLTCTSDGTVAQSSCATGCAGGQCRSFATVSTPGSVTCGTLTCSIATSGGCTFTDPQRAPASCGATAGNWSTETCDGPNDCPGGQVCCHQVALAGYVTGELAVCTSSACPYGNMGGVGELVCDPSSPVCPAGTTCQIATSFFSIYVCK